MIYHEEADTRVVLHSISNSADSLVVYARDTDILVLLLAHFEKMPCKNLWLKAGTYKKPKYFPIHELHQDLPKSQTESILAFHPITGCDSVSFCWSLKKNLLGKFLAITMNYCVVWAKLS